MRRSLLGLTALATVLLFAACEGPQGPAGPAGADGADGADGVDGVDGVNAAETCSDCHNDDTELLARQIQYSKSKHATGDTYGRSGASCAGCHTNEGFIERMNDGTFEASTDVLNPTPTNCRTCHMVHSTYQGADLALRPEAIVPFNLEIAPTVEVDLGNGTLCSNCHQPRPRYLADISEGVDYTVTSSRFGPHHGPQSSVLLAAAGFEYAGQSYGSSNHNLAPDGCVTCHMAEPPEFANSGGGHTFSPVLDDHGDEILNVTGCYTEGCHNVTNTPEEDLMLAAETKMAVIWDDVNGNGLIDAGDTGTLYDLKAQLVQVGLLNADTELNNTNVTFPGEVMGALWNYQTVREDRSKGLHNFNYAQKLLSTSITVMADYITNNPPQ